jgi:topoisomerase-4 subunit A
MTVESPELFGTEGVTDNPIGAFAERAYLDYALSVVKGRALPDVRDGQKPVQRRILYAMNELGIGPTAKPRKSAAVVGDVLGKLHPHGDQSVYDALVRMAQDFSLRYPLIDGQGNFGSRDGDGAAAMRYTECRLTPVSRLLMDELDQGTIDFGPNYDGQFREPTVLPARLPMVLLNGASGIAVGMATEIPSHNLREVAAAAVALIRDPQLLTSKLLEYIPAPDYAGGAQIISSPAEIAAAYASGRGSLKVRARWSIEELAKNQWQVVINELPPGVACAKVAEQLEEATNPKIKANKKALDQAQLTLKQAVLAVLENVRDESGKKHAVRLVLSPRSSKISKEEFMAVLLAHTGLETSVPINLVSVGLDGRPTQKSLLQMLSEWVEFRFDTVRRRLNHRLEKVNHRLHILAGRKLVLLNLDEVIHIIRHSDEPKAALMDKFALSEVQAEDILEIRLRQLARLEGFKLDQEIGQLEEEKGGIEYLLANEGPFKDMVVSEIESDAKLYGDDRRTLVEEAQRISAAAVQGPDEATTLIVSQKGWVRQRQGHSVEPASLSFKEGDGLLCVVQCRTVDAAIFVGENGRVFSTSMSAIPGGRGDGAPLSSLFDLGGARICGVVAGPVGQKVFLMGSHGYGFTCAIEDMVGRQKAGKVFLTVEAGQKTLAPQPVSGRNMLAMRSSSRLLAIWLDEVRALPRGGKGLQLIGLADGDEVVEAITAPSGFELVGTDSMGLEVKEVLHGDDVIGRRASKGRPISLQKASLKAATTS